MTVQEENHVGTVTANDDPEMRGRIRCSCVGLLADEDGELPMWIEPVHQWGWFTVPDVGEIVELVLNAHGETDDSYNQSSIDTPNVRWRGTRYWSQDQDGDTAREVPEDFKTNYGKRRGFATPAGHVLVFDDTEGMEKISLTHKSLKEGVDAFAFVSMDENGSVIISNRNGTLIYLNANEGQFTIVDEFGNSYTSDADGMRLIDNFSNIIEMKDGAVQVLAQDAFVVSGPDATLDAGTYNLGTGAAKSTVLGEDLIIWLNSHVHPTGMGPSGPPSVPAIPTDFLSLIGKLG